MSERPLNERPAAKPAAKAIKPEVAAASETPVEYVKVPSFWSTLGCGGWAILILLVLGLLSFVGSAITTAITDSQKSSGQESYDVTPDTVDPRSTYTISAKCEAAMAASAADPTENGERLLKETGNLCGSQEEWEAALYKYPRAIGVVDGKFLDGSEFGLLCNGYPEVKICKANN
jgi:hypothetical protein